MISRWLFNNDSQLHIATALNKARKCAVPLVCYTLNLFIIQGTFIPRILKVQNKLF